jgi:hypothetical protein
VRNKKIGDALPYRPSYFSPEKPFGNKSVWISITNT